MGLKIAGFGHLLLYFVVAGQLLFIATEFVAIHSGDHPMTITPYKSGPKYDVKGKLTLGQQLCELLRETHVEWSAAAATLSQKIMPVHLEQGFMSVKANNDSVTNSEPTEKRKPGANEMEEIIENTENTENTENVNTENVENDENGEKQGNENEKEKEKEKEKENKKENGTVIGAIVTVNQPFEGCSTQLVKTVRSLESGSKSLVVIIFIAMMCGCLAALAHIAMLFFGVTRSMLLVVLLVGFVGHLTGITAASLLFIKTEDSPPSYVSAFFYANVAIMAAVIGADFVANILFLYSPRYSCKPRGYPPASSNDSPFYNSANHYQGYVHVQN